jgi:hypothetical protein
MSTHSESTLRRLNSRCCAPRAALDDVRNWLPRSASTKTKLRSTRGDDEHNLGSIGLVVGTRRGERTPQRLWLSAARIQN